MMFKFYRINNPAGRWYNWNGLTMDLAGYAGVDPEHVTIRETDDGEFVFVEDECVGSIDFPAAAVPTEEDFR